MSEVIEQNELEEEDEISLKQIILSGAIFALALILEHFPVLQSIPFLKSYEQIIKLLPIILFLISYLLCGLNVVKNAVKNIFHGEIFDEQFLMAVASIGAVAIGEYPEAVAVMLFYQIGEYFQDYVVNNSKTSITSLMALRPDKAFVKRQDSFVAVNPEDVELDDVIQVKPGERIPLDGVITSGESFVETSALTGESVPRSVGVGFEVLAGFVNTEGVLEIRVTKKYGDSAIARVLELTQNAAEKKSKAEKFITRFSKIYTPIVCVLALVIAILPPLIVGGAVSGVWSKWISRSLMFLVVSCPCALVISVPLSFFGGIGAASKNGILIKGSNHLEALANVKTAVFDKTGTLTKGVFVVTEIHPSALSKISEEKLIEIATHAEKYSNHPISKSLKAAHHCSECETILVKDAKEISGQGLCVNVSGDTVLAGNMLLMQNQKVKDITVCPKEDFGTIIHIAINGVYAGHIVISDEAKADSELAIRELKNIGIKQTVMLTGDTKETANAVAKTLGIDKVYAELLPEDKVHAVEKLLKDGKLLFAGDGINDAPVLALSDVGIAMGALGSDAAIEAADVVIMTDEISKVPEGIKIARRTMSIAYENIIFALFVKVLIMVLGALGLINMWVAVFGDVGVTFIAVLNSMRLLLGKTKMAKK